MSSIVPKKLAVPRIAGSRGGVCLIEEQIGRRASRSGGTSGACTARPARRASWASISRWPRRPDNSRRRPGRASRAAGSGSARRPRNGRVRASRSGGADARGAGGSGGCRSGALRTSGSVLPSGSGRAGDRRVITSCASRACWANNSRCRPGWTCCACRASRANTRRPRGSGDSGIRASRPCRPICPRRTYNRRGSARRPRAARWSLDTLYPGRADSARGSVACRASAARGANIAIYTRRPRGTCASRGASNAQRSSRAGNS